MMSDLPKQSLDIGSPVFNNTMIDYFGAMTVKLNKGTRTIWSNIQLSYHKSNAY